MLFERLCPSCLNPARAICESCVAQLSAAPAVQIDGAVWSRAALAYDERAAALILAGKNRGRRDILRHLARALVCAVPANAEVVTWVPASAERRKERGYDQGRIIARTIARESGIGATRLLTRVGGPSQTGQNRLGRLRGPKFTAVSNDFDRVVLVDDVVTTGASLTSATSVLHQSGVKEVWTLTLAAVA